MVEIKNKRGKSLNNKQSRHAIVKQNKIKKPQAYSWKHLLELQLKKKPHQKTIRKKNQPDTKINKKHLIVSAPQWLIIMAGTSKEI